MNVQFPDREMIHPVMTLATRPPSIHNSQPWRWPVGAQSLHLYADLNRRRRWRRDGSRGNGCGCAATPGTVAEIYDRYADWLHDFCVGMVRDRVAAACVQDVFCTAATSPCQLRDPDKLWPWLYAIARNETLRCLQQLCVARVRTGRTLSSQYPCRGMAGHLVRREWRHSLGVGTGLSTRRGRHHPDRRDENCAHARHSGTGFRDSAPIPPPVGVAAAKVATNPPPPNAPILTGRSMSNLRRPALA